MDEELWFVKTMEAGRGRGCEMSSGLCSPERLWLTDPEPGCTLKGPNNSLSNGIVPLRIVYTQVRSLGVLTHQVSIGLNKTAPTIRAKFTGGCPP